MSSASSPTTAAAAAAPSTSSVTSTYSLKLDAHTDGITSLSFNSSRLLLVTSWDGGATVYNTMTKNTPSTRFPHAAAVLCGAFGQSNKLYTGGLDPTVKSFALDAEGRDSSHSLGAHEAAVRCANWIPAVNCLLTGSWDCTGRLWDDRGANCEVGNVHLPDKVFAQDVCEHMIVFALADGTVHAYDLRQGVLDPASLVCSRLSTLGHQIRCVKFAERGNALLLGSIEGRVAVENLVRDSAPSLQQQTLPIKRYAFKCHRQGEWIYPVHAMDVLAPSSSTATTTLFATGGGDGTVHLWDATAKKRLIEFPKLETSCSALAFAPRNESSESGGGLLAISQSYTFDRGELPRQQQAEDKVLLCEFTL